MISFDTFFQALVPKDKKFLPLFIEAAGNALKTAEVFHKALHADSVTRLTLLKEINVLERQGDEYTHVIVNEASSTFIVPFDREDIQSLAVAIDDVLDYMNGCAKRIELYKIHNITPEMLQLADVILKACREFEALVRQMSDLKYTAEVQASLARISEYEKQADGLFDKVVSRLFAEEKDALEILKMKEVYSFFSATTDKVEDASSVIENILVKFS